MRCSCLLRDAEPNWGLDDGVGRLQDGERSIICHSVIIRKELKGQQDGFKSGGTYLASLIP